MGTPQFELSEKLLDKRYVLDVRIETVANITNETTENYLKMEYASSNIPVERYREALNKFTSLNVSREQSSLALMELIFYSSMSIIPQNVKP